MRLVMFQRKAVWLPTWRGWLALGGLAVALLCVVLGGLYPFLAVNRPAAADILVVEGWVPDEVLDQAVLEYRRGHYRMIVTTGCPIEYGTYTMPYGNYADMSMAALKHLGLSDNEVKSVPAGKVRKDRTYHSALALRTWMGERGTNAGSINIVTCSCHARRTRLMFEKAFEGQMTVGILAFEGKDYNASNWWRCSSGVRETVGELIAYAYARILFNPANG